MPDIFIVRGTFGEYEEENVWDVGWTDSKEDADARVRKMNALSEHHHALEEVALANFHKEHTAVGELLAATPEERRAAVSAYYRSDPFMAAARERQQAEATRTAEAQKAIGDPRWRHLHWPPASYHVVAI